MTTDPALTVAHTLAGLPVSDMARAEDWYVRLFGRPADAKVRLGTLRDPDGNRITLLETTSGFST